MDASKINWILAIGCLLAGVGLGALGYHLFNSSATGLQKMRQRLAERDRELATLRTGMDDHLDEVSRLVADLQRDSEALANRVALDARSLGGKSATVTGMTIATGQASPTGDSEEPAMPRDYAKGSGGTLSEDFGLKNDEDAKAPQPPRY